jgi:hypothetical protein
MTLEEAKKALGDSLKPDGSVYELGQYMCYSPGDKTVCLDADFNADELEALVVYMRATTNPGGNDGTR